MKIRGYLNILLLVYSMSSSHLLYAQAHIVQPLQTEASLMSQAVQNFGFLGKKIDTQTQFRNRTLMQQAMSWSDSAAKDFLLKALFDEYSVSFRGVEATKEGYYFDVPESLSRDFLLNLYTYFNQMRKTRLELPLLLDLRSGEAPLKVDVKPEGIFASVGSGQLVFGDKLASFFENLDRELNSKLYTDYDLHGLKLTRVRDELFPAYVRNRFGIELSNSKQGTFSKHDYSALHAMLSKLPGHFFSKNDPESPQLMHFGARRLSLDAIQKNDAIEKDQKHLYSEEARTLHLSSDAFVNFDMKIGGESRMAITNQGVLPEEVMLSAMGEAVWESLSEEEKAEFASYSWEISPSSKEDFVAKADQDFIFPFLEAAGPKAEFASLFATYINRSDLFFRHSARLYEESSLHSARPSTKMEFFLNKVFKGAYYERKVLHGMELSVESENEDDRAPLWENGKLEVKVEEPDEDHYDVYFRIRGLKDPPNANGKPGSGIASVSFDWNMISGYGGKFVRGYINDFPVNFDEDDLVSRKDGIYAIKGASSSSEWGEPRRIAKKEMVWGLYMPVLVDVKDGHGNSTRYVTSREGAVETISKVFNTETNPAYVQAMEGKTFYVPDAGVATTHSGNTLQPVFIGTNGEREALIKDKVEKGIAGEQSIFPSEKTMDWENVELRQKEDAGLKTYEFVLPYDFTQHKKYGTFGFLLFLRNQDTNKRAYFSIAKHEAIAPGVDPKFPKGASILRFFPGDRLPTGRYNVENIYAFSPGDNVNSLDEKRAYRVPQDKEARVSFEHQARGIANARVDLDWSKKEFYEVSTPKNALGGTKNLVLSVPLKEEIANVYESHPQGFDLSVNFTVLDPHQGRLSVKLLGGPREGEKNIFRDANGILRIRVVLPLPPQHKAGSYEGYNLSLRKEFISVDTKETAMHKALGHEPLMRADDDWDYQMNLGEVTKLQQLREAPKVERPVEVAP